MSYRGKCILLGNPKVGKTSLLSRYVDNTFPDQYNPTIGANFLIKEVDLKDIIDNLTQLDEELKKEIKKKGFKIYFWDIGGQRDKLFANEYYFQDAVGAIVVFDLIDRDSFENLEFWISKLKKLSGEEVPFIIVGNKIDLSKERKISEKEIKDKANKYEVEYFETSAKVNENVIKAFEALSIKILNNLK
jgi:Ras-related protein Rab-1A